MAVDQLVVLIEGQRAGDLEQDGHGRHRFTYDDDYRRDPNSTPLSTSMPRTAAEHSGRALRSFMAGLLPENADVLTRWAREFDAKPNNPFGLLKHVGEDVAGAAQFVRTERVDELEPGTIDWLDDTNIGDRIRALRADPSAWIPEFSRGRFSLAGAQAKFALIHTDGRWGEPSGALPTTHIIKPTTGRFADQDIAEHVTMRAAAMCGLTVATSSIGMFDGEHAIVVERCDRVHTTDGWVRVHQEDCCQAAARPPQEKYDVEPNDILRLLRDLDEEADVDVLGFIEALAYNWLVGGTDAHGKNYSLLLAGPEVRLAPFYDITSVLPYVSVGPGRVADDAVKGDGLEMAMHVGRHDKFADVTVDDWAAVARMAALDPNHVVERVRDLSNRVPDAVADAASEAGPASSSEIPQLLKDRVGRHVERCQLGLAGRPAGRARRSRK